MINTKAIGYITANYTNDKNSPLFVDRPLASLPIAGRYRLIDFPLSNLVNAGIRTVGIAMPGNYRSLIDHLSSGKEWELDRKKGGLFFLPGNAYGASTKGMRFLLRDLITNKSLFQRASSPYVVMCGTNIIFNADLNQVILAHAQSGADITMMYLNSEHKHGDNALTLHFNEQKRVESITHGVQYGDAKFLDCCVINRDLLLDIIEQFSAYDYLDLFEAIQGEFGHLNIQAYKYDGVALGVFDAETYFRRSASLLNPSFYDQLFCPERPIRTKSHDAPPAKFTRGSFVRNSLISANCVIEGTVRNSILSRKVNVEIGASVTNCIIMQSCTIKRGARVENAIIDKNNVIPAGTELRGTPESTLIVSKAPVETVEVQ